jgi:hypothetical protein
MASDDKKTETSSAPKNETAVKKDEGQPKNKIKSDAEVIVGAKAKNRFQKLIRITGTRFLRKRRNDSWMSGAALRPPTSFWMFGKFRCCAFACGHQAKIDRRY